jgi:hypothetical protein
MAVFKFSPIFELATNSDRPDATVHRVGGWSESWYIEGSDVADVERRCLDYCIARAQMLPTGAAIIGQRYQQVDPGIGASQTRNIRYIGGLVLCDVPQMALLVRQLGSSGSRRRMIEFRGIPDAYVIRGEYTPSDTFERAVANVMTNIHGGYNPAGRYNQGPFQMRVRSRTALLAVDNIADNGAITWVADPALPNGTLVRPYRMKNTAGKSVQGVYKYLTGVTPITGKLLAWNKGTVIGQNMRVVAYGWEALTGGYYVQRATLHKVGRPFELYVGRVSRRNRA